MGWIIFTAIVIVIFLIANSIDQNHRITEIEKRLDDLEEK